MPTPASFIPLPPLSRQVTPPSEDARRDWKQAIAEAIPGYAAGAMAELERSPVLKTAELQDVEVAGSLSKACKSVAIWVQAVYEFGSS